MSNLIHMFNFEMLGNLKAKCGYTVAKQFITTNAKEVTCKKCLENMGKK